MRITANQLTLGRLLLLPLPVYLIHVGMLRGGGFPWLVAALLVFLVLGLTDAWDGMLARRYGSTPLGSLLDTVADKIFLVGTYGVLAQHGIVPLAPVAALFVRELAVTRLRGIALEEKFSLPTSRIAKLKTTAQMAGSGYLMLIWILPHERTILPLLFALAAGAAMVPVLAYLRGRTPGWRAWWGVGLISLVAVWRTVFSAASTKVMLLTVALLFTVLSGVEYAWQMRRVLIARFARAPVELVRLAALSLVIPLLWLPALNDGTAGHPYVVLGLLAAELAIGGLDNSLAQTGRIRGPVWDLVRTGIQAACGLLLSVPMAWLGLAVTVADLVQRSIRHAGVFRGVGSFAPAT
ncbi:MAG TPA: CDP-alcohol phosphatidyltransferase family protein [Candidatus Polarisedimenticolaceae bacterium]|nr:CDP-alcohol phosphatidyltransferase family protein [Candidatus Polarisedimenticolaceae bacterium]